MNNRLQRMQQHLSKNTDGIKDAQIKNYIELKKLVGPFLRPAGISKSKLFTKEGEARIVSLFTTKDLDFLCCFDLCPNLDSIEETLNEPIYTAFYKEIIKHPHFFSDGNEMEIEVYIQICDYLALVSCLCLTNTGSDVKSIFSKLTEALNFGSEYPFNEFQKGLALKLCCTWIDTMDPADDIKRTFKHDLFRTFCDTGSNAVSKIGIRFAPSSSNLGWEVAAGANMLIPSGTTNVPEMNTLVNRYVLLHELGILELLDEKFNFKNLPKDSQTVLISMILGFNSTQAESVKGWLKSPRPSDKCYPLKDKNINFVQGELAKLGIMKAAPVNNSKKR